MTFHFHVYQNMYFPFRRLMGARQVELFNADHLGFFLQYRIIL